MFNFMLLQVHFTFGVSLDIVSKFFGFFELNFLLGVDASSFARALLDCFNVFFEQLKTHFPVTSCNHDISF